MGELLGEKRELPCFGFGLLVFPQPKSVVFREAVPENRKKEV